MTDQAPSWKRDRLAALEAQARARSLSKLKSFKPYEKQHEFFTLGISKRERLAMAGNQCGKSEAGAFEVACNLTGIYPPWWTGKRFDHPTRFWACGDGAVLVRDVLQAKL